MYLPASCLAEVLCEKSACALTQSSSFVSGHDSRYEQPSDTNAVGPAAHHSAIPKPDRVRVNDTYVRDKEARARKREIQRAQPHPTHESVGNSGVEAAPTSAAATLGWAHTGGARLGIDERGELESEIEALELKLALTTLTYVCFHLEVQPSFSGSEVAVVQFFLDEIYAHNLQHPCSLHTPRHSTC